MGLLPVARQHILAGPPTDATSDACYGVAYYDKWCCTANEEAGAAADAKQQQGSAPAPAPAPAPASAAVSSGGGGGSGGIGRRVSRL